MLGGICVISTGSVVSMMSSCRCAMRSVVQRMIPGVQLRLKLCISLQRAKMLQIREDCRSSRKGLPAGIRAIATVSMILRGSILGSKVKFCGSRAIVGVRVGPLGGPGRSKMLRNGESSGARRKRSLVSNEVVETINVVPSSSSLSSNVRFAVRIAIFGRQFRPISGMLQLLGRMNQGARAVGRRPKCLV